MNNAPFKVGDNLTVTEDFYESYKGTVLFRNPFKLTNDLILDVEEDFLVKTQIVSENKFVKYVNIPIRFFTLNVNNEIKPPLIFKEDSDEKDDVFSEELLKKLNDLVLIMLESQKNIDSMKKRIDDLEVQLQNLTPNEGMSKSIQKLREEIQSGKLFADSLELVVKKKRKNRIAEA